MVIANHAKTNKVQCCDCNAYLDVEDRKIKDGVLLVYDNSGKKVSVVKCSSCFKISPGLKNYQECEVYSRIVGYLRPVKQWNEGKQREFNDRKEYKAPSLKE